MFRTPFVPRLLALGASVAMSFAVVTLIADHALPGDAGTQMLAKVTPITAASVH